MPSCAMSEGVYETGTAATVLAFHVMPGLPPPEGRRHSHDYRIEVVVSRDQLDERGMVVDLDVLNAAVSDVVARLDGADLDAIVSAPRSGGVTVEVFACWVHDELARLVGTDQSLALAVRVWESPTAFGGYRLGRPAR